MNLTEGSIPTLIKQIAIPASVGFFFHTMYNVVDTFYAGLLSTEAIAALSLSFPIFFIIIALASGVATGTTVLITNRLGEKKVKSASRYAIQGVGFGLFIALILTFVGLLVSPSLFRFLGASGTYFDIATSYMNIIFYGTVFFVLPQVINATLQSTGDTKSLRNAMVVGFFINLILNPIFALGWLGFPAMGVAGIALATILIQCGTTIYLFKCALKTKLWRGVTKRAFKPAMRIYKDISVQGFPASLNMVTVAIGIFLITYFISPFGATTVAAYGIATRIEQIFLMPTIGLNIAALTLIGQNNGAKKYERVKDIYFTCLKYGFWISMIGLVVVFAIPKLLMKIFTQDAAVIAIGVPYLYIAAFLFFGYVILFMTVSLYQGLKIPSFGLYVGMLRQIIFPLILFPLFIYVFNWGIYGAWWAVFAVVVLSAIPVGFMGWRKIKHLDTH